MRVGLDREEAAIDCIDRGQLPCARAQSRQVVDVMRRALVGQRQQSFAFVGSFPPARPAPARAAVDLPPARPEHAGLVDRHSTAVDQRCVQLGQHAVGIGFVDHETQVEVVRRLRDQVHALLSEHRPDVGELVQHRAHAAPDQGDCRARRDDLDPADLRKVLRQAREHVGIDQVFVRIERNRHVGFRRADHVDRQAVPTEALEHVGEEADLLPHPHRFHRHQHDAVATTDRLDAGHGGDAGIDAGAGLVGPRGIEDRHRHAGVAAGADRARMQYLGAGTGDFLRLGVVEPRQQARIGDLARIGAEHAGHVSPYLDALGTEQGTEVRRGRVRTTTPEDRGAAIAMPGDEPLGDDDRSGLTRESRLPVGVSIALAVHRKAVRPVALVGHRQRIQPLARIAPAGIESLRREIGRAERRRHQLALREHLRLPVVCA